MALTPPGVTSIYPSLILNPILFKTHSYLPDDTPFEASVLTFHGLCGNRLVPEFITYLPIKLKKLILWEIFFPFSLMHHEEGVAR